MDLMFLIGLFYHVEWLVLLSVESQAGKRFGDNSVPSWPSLFFQWIVFCMPNAR